MLSISKMKGVDFPLVSVLIPCYNAERTIENTVLSVINQDYPNIEVLINDDYSTDGTLTILKENTRHTILSNPVTTDPKGEAL